jgi:hypothetical protein
MGSVKEILHRDPPGILYHYTNQAGLLGIINTKEIWASHTQYLNDQREFRHAIDIAKAELESMLHAPAYAEHRVLLEEMQIAIAESIESVNVCVCSFSENGDLLSQWRAYGGGSGGYSIAFNGRFLRQICDHEDCWLVPCQYSELDQRQLIKALLEDVLHENLNYVPEDEADGSPVGGNLVAYLNRYAPILKHSSFDEEREWRVVSRPLSCKHERFGYRPGSSMLIPYFRIALEHTGCKFQIEKVIAGPTPHTDQARHSVRGFLVKRDLRNAIVENSRTPFRNW